MSADNQQERLDPNWVAGFVDGEGCFHVAFNRQPKMRLGLQVLPEFRIVQHARDELLLHRVKSFFGCGKVTFNHGDRKELRIRGLENLSKVVEFFNDFPLQTKKRHDFECFADIIQMMKRGLHNDRLGIAGIVILAGEMNRRKLLKDLESSETICLMPQNAVKI